MYLLSLNLVFVYQQSEIGLVIGQIDGEEWVFIDEILPNGMIDTHGKYFNLD